jgi:ribonuclease BN (tRNA processing enzyme)/DNA-binding NarL/FixJ family response regulator
MPPSKKKVLIADNSKELLESIIQDERASLFEIEIAAEGSLCLEKIKTFEPDLVIVEFMLSGAHGIEVLQTVKKHPATKNSGVILTDYHCLLQNYNTATLLRLDYLLEKPFTPNDLFDLVELFFAGNLKPQPFAQQHKDEKTKSKVSHKKPEEASYIKFWGTRGSYPVAGPEYNHFGGNTSTLEIRHNEDLVIIDAGTGIRTLGQMLSTHEETKFNLILSHTHWDHLLGFPFFLPLHQAGNDLKVFVPVSFEKSSKELFADILDYSYFPVSFDDIRSNLSFSDLRDSEKIQIGDIHIETHYAFHPGPTLCFKIEVGDKTIGYVTDNEFLQGCTLPLLEIEKDEEQFTPYLSLIEFLKGCDTLIHEAQYSEEEYVDRIGWGHSSINNASILIKKAEIKHWIVVHHDPRHTDTILQEKQKKHEEILKELGHECLVELGYDGMLLPL